MRMLAASEVTIVNQYASHFAETSSPDLDIGGDVAADGMTPSALGAAVEKKVRHKSLVRAIFSLVRDWPRLMTTLSTNLSKNIRPLHVRHYPTFLMMSLRFKRHLTRFVKCFATVLVDEGEDVWVGVSNTSGCNSAITSLPECKYHFLISERLSQDVLENYFGTVRMK